MIRPGPEGGPDPAPLDEIQIVTWAYARVTRCAPPSVLVGMAAWVALSDVLLVTATQAGRFAMLLAAPAWIALVAASRRLQRAMPVVIADEDREEARSRKRWVRTLQVLDAGILMLLFWGWGGEQAVSPAAGLGLSACVLALPMAWMTAGDVLRAASDARLGALLTSLGAIFAIPQTELWRWPQLLAAAAVLWLAIDAATRGLERHRLARRLTAVRQATGLAEPDLPEDRADDATLLARLSREHRKLVRRHGLELAVVGGLLLPRLVLPADALSSRVLIVAAPLAWIAVAWTSSRLRHVSAVPGNRERAATTRWTAMVFAPVSFIVLYRLFHATWYRAAISRDAALAMGVAEAALIVITLYLLGDEAEDNGLWLSMAPLADLTERGTASGLWSWLGPASLIVGAWTLFRANTVQRRLRALQEHVEKAR